MFNDYGCSCVEGFLNRDEKNLQSSCIIDYCYNVDCESGECEASSNSYSCSCDMGTIKRNETNPQSKCFIDHCYGVDCKNGDCENTLNEYVCQCDPGSRFKDYIELL